MKFIQELTAKPERENTGLLKELCESALIRTTVQMHQYDARDIADFAYLYFLTLQVLREDFHSVPFTQAYAGVTLRWGAHFDKFASAGNDLYVLLHILSGHSRDYLNHSLANAAFFKHFHMDLHQAVWMLRQLNSNQRSASTETRFLMQLERELKIDSSNYKSCRRLINNWNSIEKADQRLVITRLLQAFRTRMNRSELLAPLQAFSDRHNMELKGVTNAETGEMDKATLLVKGAELSAKTGLKLPVALSLIKKGIAK